MITNLGGNAQLVQERTLVLGCIAAQGKRASSCSCYDHLRYLWVVASQQHPPSARTAEECLYSTSSICTDGPFPFSILGVRRGEWRPFCCPLRRSAVQLDKSFFEPGYLGSESPAGSNGSFSFGSGGRQHAVVRRLRTGSGNPGHARDRRSH